MAGKKKQRNQVVSKNNSLWEWAVLLLFAVFMVLWPYQYGFFKGMGLHSSSQLAFEKKFYYGIMLGIAALILAVVKFIRKEAWEKRHIYALIGLVLPLLYLINSFTAESPYLATSSLHNSIMLYSFFLIGLLVADKTKILNYLVHVYFVIGSIVVIYSFSYLFGNQYRMDALTFVDGVRLTSIFTYANAYAAFLLTLLLTALYQLNRNSSRVVQLSYGFMLLPIMASLILTLSRGAIFMIPVIVIVALLLVDLKKQLQMLINFLLSAVFAFAIQNPLSERGTEVFNRAQEQIAAQQAVKHVGYFEGDSISSWLLIIGLSIVMAFLVFVVNIFYSRLSFVKYKKSKYRWLVPGITVVVSIVAFIILRSGVLNSILPTQIRDRINNLSLNTHSVLERLTFYKNSLSIWKENPILGGGGGTWETLYDKYQSYPYVSSQTHSYPMELFLDTGIIGFLVIIGGLAYILISNLIRVFKSNSENKGLMDIILIVPLSILLHSIIDFEMSYAFFGILVFFCIGVLAGQDRKQVFTKLKLDKQYWLRIGASAVWVFLAFVLLIGTGNAFGASSKYYESMNNLNLQAAFPQVVNPLEKGLNEISGHPVLLNQLSYDYMSAYNQTKDNQYLVSAQKYVQELKDAEPHSWYSLNTQYDLAKLEGRIEEAAVIMEAAIEQFPFEISYYKQAIESRYDVWNAVSDAEEKKQQVLAVHEIMKKYQQRTDDLTKISKNIIYGRTFVLGDDVLKMVDAMK